MRCDAVVSCDVVVGQQGLCRRLRLGRSSPHQEEKEWLDAIGGVRAGQGQGVWGWYQECKSDRRIFKHPGEAHSQLGEAGDVCYFALLVQAGRAAARPIWAGQEPKKTGRATCKSGNRLG